MSVNQRWRVKGVIAFIFACVFFSGVMKSDQWWGVFDFLTMAGSFGHVVHQVDTTLLEGQVTEVVASTTSFRGKGGSGARDGFIFALTLAPMVIFAMGIFAVIESMGALDVARRLMEPLFRPLLAIPGIAGLTALGSFQTVDVGAAMTNDLLNKKHLNAREKLFFTQFQFCAGGWLTNFLMTGSVLLALSAEDGSVSATSIGLVLIVNLLMKVFATNLLRAYVHFFDPHFGEDKAPSQPSLQETQS